MRVTNKQVSWVLGGAGLLALVLAAWLNQFTLWAVGVIALALASWQGWRAWRGRAQKASVPKFAPADLVAPSVEAPEVRFTAPRRRLHRTGHDDDLTTLVEQMLAQRRHALLLRPQIAAQLNREQFDLALEMLQDEMSLVPEGEVVLGRIDDALEDGRLELEELDAAFGTIVAVQSVFLDRYPVTNRQFFDFVAAGGYEQMAIWDPEIWPAVLDFVDRTGCPGPRFWRNGRYLPGDEEKPVVGASWYEAGAYARWVGKRLPSDAEWVKAGAWPVTLSASTRLQRKFPWGDSLDRSRANLWGSGPGCVVPVDQFPGGVSVGGIHQLLGNVWEWTADDFGLYDQTEEDVALTRVMKSLRGGAFDTYFESQATCQFQSGDNPVVRKHNIGFRCAVGLCDLAIVPVTSDAAEHAEITDETLQEVQA